MYKRLFDEGVERRGTHCLKWDAVGQVFGEEGLLPLWVADMDFRAPECVQQALSKLIAHGAYGYGASDPEHAQAVIDWMRARHDTLITPEQIESSPCVVDSLNLLAGAYTQPGDMIAVQTPVYGPFLRVATRMGRVMYENPLVNAPGGWEMDLNGLEEGFRRGVKLFILCNPHNPVGRVYTRAELEALCALAERYNVTIVSDEIHADFEMPGHKHICILNLTRNAVALISATKTFNIAALRQSSMLFGTQELKRQAMEYWRGLGVGGENLFGMTAQSAAYRGGGEWLDALIEYVYSNYTYMRARLADGMPTSRVSELEGTYLMWVDLRGYGMNGSELGEFIKKRAGLALSGGEFFGARGEGFTRINLAAPRSTIERAADKLINAFSPLEKCNH